MSGQEPENPDESGAVAPEELQMLLLDAKQDAAPAAQAEQTEPEKPDHTEEYTKLIGQILGPGFEVLAPAWGVEEREVNALAAAYAPLLQKYFPDGPEEVGPEFAAVFVTLTVIGPRVMSGRPRKVPQSAPQPQGGGDGTD